MSRRPIGLVAGSGIDLLPLLDRVTSEQPFEAVPGLANCTVEGHAGRFVHGCCGHVPVVVQCGRFHVYEGRPILDVARTVDALASFGVHALVFTNAAGGLLPAMEPGDLVAVDRIRVMPCRVWEDPPESIEVDALVPGCARRGMYMWVHGPSYETRSEIRLLQELGGAAVGMSTAPELWRSKALGMRAAVVSCITNNCCRPQVLTHDHVVATASRASQRIVGLLRRLLPAFP